MLNLVPQATWELFQPKLGKQKIKALLNQKKKKKDMIEKQQLLKKKPKFILTHN